MDHKTHTTEDLKHSILSRIETEQVAPRSKWSLAMSYGAFSLASFLSVVIGAVAVAVMIFTSLNAGWEYYEMTHENALTFIFNALPYIWITVLILTVVSGYFNMRHTKKGYKYSLGAITLMLIGTSLVGGTTLYAFKVGSQVDGLAHTLFPNQYKTVYTWQKDMWHEPEKGRIFGEVTTTSTDIFSVRDIKGDVWMVNTTALKSMDMERVVVNEEVRLLGVVSTEDDTVVGCMVLPGVKEMPPSMNEVAKRRNHFKERIASQRAMALMEEPDPERRVIYRTCRDLVVSIIEPSARLR